MITRRTAILSSIASLAAGVAARVLPGKKPEVWCSAGWCDGFDYHHVYSGPVANFRPIMIVTKDGGWWYDESESEWKKAEDA